MKTAMLCVGISMIMQAFINHTIYSNIKESRHREELLYKEVKNIDYLIDVLTKSYLASSPNSK